MLTETPPERKSRVEQEARKTSSADMVKVLIDDVILAVKINVSMHSIQEINSHLAKYVKIPERWHSKNYAFEFVECISVIFQRKVMDELRKSAFHTLIVDKSTDITIQNMLILTCRDSRHIRKEAKGLVLICQRFLTPMFRRI